GLEPLAATSRTTAPTMIAQPQLPGTPQPSLVSPTAPTVAQHKKSKLPLILGAAVVAIGGAAVVAMMKKPPPSAPPPLAAPVEKKAPPLDTAALRSKALELVTRALKDGDPALRRQ